MTFLFTYVSKYHSAIVLQIYAFLKLEAVLKGKGTDPDFENDLREVIGTKK
jgi:hypothetical protein